MFNQFRHSSSEFWAARNARERMLLTAGAALILLALIYLLLLAPALTGREKLKKDLPQLRQEAAQMQAMAKEAGAVSNRPATSAPPLTKESIDVALARKGLKSQNVTVTGDTGRMQLASVSFSALLDWIDDMQKNGQVSVTDVNIVALPQPDTVNATLTLHQQKSE